MEEKSNIKLADELLEKEGKRTLRSFQFSAPIFTALVYSASSIFDSPIPDFWKIPAFLLMASIVGLLLAFNVVLGCHYLVARRNHLRTRFLPGVVEQKSQLALPSVSSVSFKRGDEALSCIAKVSETKSKVVFSRNLPSLQVNATINRLQYLTGSGVSFERCPGGGDETPDTGEAQFLGITVGVDVPISLLTALLKAIAEELPGEWYLAMSIDFSGNPGQSSELICVGVRSDRFKSSGYRTLKPEDIHLIDTQGMLAIQRLRTFEEVDRSPFVSRSLEEVSC